VKVDRGDCPDHPVAAVPTDPSVESLRFAYYNFVRIHSALRVTPAMAAGVTDRAWSLEDLIATL